jgi:hypothetical protein
LRRPGRFDPALKITSGLIRRPSGLPSIADILLHCREPPLGARSGSRPRSIQLRLGGTQSGRGNHWDISRRFGIVRFGPTEYRRRCVDGPPPRVKVCSRYALDKGWINAPRFTSPSGSRVAFSWISRGRTTRSQPKQKTKWAMSGKTLAPRMLIRPHWGDPRIRQPRGGVQT